MPQIIDSHIHLSHIKFDGEFTILTYAEGEYATVQHYTRAQLANDLRAAGISACIDPAIDITSNARVLAAAQEFPGFVYPAVGVHPTRTYQYMPSAAPEKPDRPLKLHWRDRRALLRYAADPRVIAIGETGLDYHKERRTQHRLRQKAWFLWQLRLAHKKALPVILHIRAAHTDAFRILKRHRKWLHGGVCHCFRGDAAQAGELTSLGLMLGIGGALLQQFSGLPALEQAVRETPLEFLLLETDGPEVAPACPDLPEKRVRRARNTSLILPAVAERIAALKGISADEVITVTAENAERLFHLHGRPT